MNNYFLLVVWTQYRSAYEGCPENIQQFWISREPHSQILSLSTAILALGKAISCRESNMSCRGPDRPRWFDALPKKNLHESCRLGRPIVVMKMICSLGHSEWDGYAVYKFSQRRLTADWLAPQENDCLRMRSKVSSDWLPSYIKATQPVLKIFKMAGYFPDSTLIKWPFLVRMLLKPEAVIIALI